jgi:hypothetical protein
MHLTPFWICFAATAIFLFMATQSWRLLLPLGVDFQFVGFLVAVLSVVIWHAWKPRRECPGCHDLILGAAKSDEAFCLRCARSSLTFGIR